MNNKGKQKQTDQRNYMLLLLILLLLLSYAAVMLYKSQNEPKPAADAGSSESVMLPDVAETAPQTTPAPVQTAPIPVPDREIYLTFDDGPCENTLQVLDILDQYGAKATFFTVGAFVDRYPEYAAEIVKRGNLIACHSYTHDFQKCYASADAFMNEIDQWKRAVTQSCGSVPERLCVRFPGGSTTKHAASVVDAIKGRLSDADYRWFDWDAGDNDKWPKGNTEGLPAEEYYWQSYEKCMGWFKNDPDKPVVFLFHDTESGTVHILADVLQDLQQRGYAFKKLDAHPDWN